jgi:Ca2+-binding RTX toxin-like protein
VGTIQGSAVNNTITGTTGNDTMDGQAGNDTIDGAAGNDVINGGAGADTLRGGEGNDTFVASGAQLNGDSISGGVGDDKLLLSSNTGVSGAFTFDSLETLDMNGMTLNLNTTQAIDLSSLSLLNGGVIEGNGSANTITGTAGNDAINGLGGSDALNGAAGNDVIYGGAGGDRISGGQGNDSLYARLDATTDTTTDTFVWQWGDRGTAGAPTVDTVFGFSTRSAGSGGDVLDLSGLLRGESATGLSLSEYLNGGYLNIQLAGADTELHIRSGGASEEDQIVTVSGANLFALYRVDANDSQALMGLMVTQGNLVT